MKHWQIQLLRRGLSLLPRKVSIKAEFYLKVRYLPDLKAPKTFNEKIQRRKLGWQNPLFAVCSDKLKMRAFVAKHAGEQFLVPLLFQGRTLDRKTLDALLEKHGRVVVKVTNDQGSVVILEDQSSSNERESALKYIRSRIKGAHRYGQLRLEGWYSANTANIVVEQGIGTPGKVLEDYKIHTFHKDDQFSQILAIDFERGSETRSRTFYDTDLNTLPIKQAAFTNFNKPCPLSRTDAEQLFSVARQLASQFSYARVDLYFVNGKVYVGEITFAPGSGFTRFENYKDDLYLGQLWLGDPIN